MADPGEKLSTNINVRTPPDLVDLFESILGRIDLDPCAHRTKNVPAAKHFFSKGLERDWWVTSNRRAPRIFVNPPYGRLIVGWVQECQRMGIRGAHVLMLLPSRTDTRWWQDHVFPCNALLFMRGRITFVGEQGPAKFPSCVGLWSTSKEIKHRFFTKMRERGQFV